jgi:hypothetical protein
MKIYQVDMRNGDADYAYLTLFLFSKSNSKPTQSQINTCLSLIEENDLNVLGIDDGMDIADFDFGLDQINEINGSLIESLNSNEVFYIIDAFNPDASSDNILSENGKIVLISTNGDVRYF